MNVAHQKSFISPRIYKKSHLYQIVMEYCGEHGIQLLDRKDMDVINIALGVVSLFI